VLVSKITKSDGTILYEAPQNPQRAISTEVADQVNAVLSQVISRGTGTAAQLGRPAAGKTGTAEGYRDAWFTGYTPNLATAVWVGYPQAQVPMVPPTTSITVTGGSWPAELWQDFMAEATSALPADVFTAPKTAVRSVVEPAPTTTTTAAPTPGTGPAPADGLPAPSGTSQPAGGDTVGNPPIGAPTTSSTPVSIATNANARAGGAEAAPVPTATTQADDQKGTTG
jgi:penicillin-binding protein 1A